MKSEISSTFINTSFEIVKLIRNVKGNKLEITLLNQNVVNSRFTNFGFKWSSRPMLI